MDEIRELLAVWEHQPCADVRAQLRPKMAAHLNETATRTAELTALSATLSKALAQLDDLPDRAEPCDTRLRIPCTAVPHQGRRPTVRSFPRHGHRAGRSPT
ncbi:MerR family DNA-binding protein [Rhodococcus pyridinivorans]|uniref:MerR family DNA-binding protein n=1 Tax=Rhodococcus pyridinivorans TaxID=103816 RepID=UPI0022836D96|nr:MerR family DNA-binding protein [Rhodococcus pyridinivorans]WAL49784.1 hypothetical protein OQN32_28520 [Rhodococcus pyridinivorans]